MCRFLPLSFTPSLPRHSASLPLFLGRSMKNLALAEITYGWRLRPVWFLASFFVALAVTGGSMSAIAAEIFRHRKTGFHN